MPRRSSDRRLCRLGPGRNLTVDSEEANVKRLLILMTLGTVLAVAGGCHVCECWDYAWNARFHPERNCAAQPCAQPCTPCVVTDSCCTECGPTIVAPSPCGCGGGCGCGR